MFQHCTRWELGVCKLNPDSVVRHTAAFSNRFFVKRFIRGVTRSLLFVPCTHSSWVTAAHCRCCESPLRVARFPQRAVALLTPIVEAQRDGRYRALAAIAAESLSATAVSARLLFRGCRFAASCFDGTARIAGAARSRSAWQSGHQGLQRSDGRDVLCHLRSRRHRQNDLHGGVVVTVFARCPLDGIVPAALDGVARGKGALMNPTRLPHDQEFQPASDRRAGCENVLHATIVVVTGTSGGRRGGIAGTHWQGDAIGRAHADVVAVWPCCCVQLLKCPSAVAHWWNVRGSRRSLTQRASPHASSTPGVAVTPSIAVSAVAHAHASNLD